MNQLIIQTSKIIHNLDVVKGRVGSAVIYGSLFGSEEHSILPVARTLADNGVNRFAVRRVEDASALREAGFVEQEILMLRSVIQREEIDTLLDLQVVFTISSVDTGLALNQAAQERATVAEAHLQIDTGMGFSGFLSSEQDKILLCYRSLSSVALCGVYTRIHPTAKRSRAQRQVEDFNRIVEIIKEAGYEVGIRHAANSRSLLRYPFTHFDAVRAGSVLLGRCRKTKFDNLEVVGLGRATITESRWLPKGHTVGIGAQAVILSRPTRIGILPVGYFHGAGFAPPRYTTLFGLLFPWILYKRAFRVRVGGKTAKVLGHMGKQEMAIDITNHNCSAGDDVYFDLDPQFSRAFRAVYDIE
ncbi:MAG: alanine racemase [Eubacteriales bacterium]